ncbi:glycosyltransferase family 39 protein [Methanobacterium sp. SMA-27]|uniref:ArnT family glycosyltransferase n=1 Tax=Methanobacterium sp. SMA-27 TaxID=1495336 RepID=UPI00064E20EC|nr:glycosyltransferase family 39 protein [Methanobacterium sp. SMA-27]
MKNGYLYNNWDIILVLFVYIVLTAYLFQYFQYRIGGDEISYINIAKGYAAGNLGNSINGYWSPFYSWLITPFLLFGSNPQYAVYVSKIVSIIIGFFVFISVRRFSRILAMNTTVERSILFAMIPAIVLFSLVFNTPDLLLVCLLIYYLSILFDSKYYNNWYSGALCGFVGSLAYLTKSFAFPFFLITFILFNLIFFKKALRMDKRRVLNNLIMGLLVFSIISGLWIGTISEKYGKITISTAGEYNQAMVGPEYKVNLLEHGSVPIYYIGLIKPPNNTSISIWDDISYLKIDHWNPLESQKDIQYELKLVYSNLIYTFKIIQSIMPISILILLSMVFVIFKSKNNIVATRILTYLLITMMIYIGGYCLIIPEWRYLWFIFILLMVSGFYMIDILYKDNVLTSNIRNILLFLLVFSFVIQPALEITYYATPNDGLYNLSNTLKSDYRIHGNIASNDEWMGMLTVCYYLNVKYYGTTPINSSKDLNLELKDNNITYYFVWNKTEVLNLSGYREISNGEITGLRIYSLILENN